MIYHYIQSLLRSVKKNRFFYILNFIGFLAGFLLLTIIFTFVHQELSFDRFHKNAENIYRMHSGGYGVTPLCFREKLKNKIPEITGIMRFAHNDLTIVHNNKEVHIGKTYFTDPEIFQFFSFNLLSGNGTQVLNAPFSIVLNRSTSNKLYGKRSPIGETIRTKEGPTYTITGIMEDIPYNSHIQSNAFIALETLRYIGDENTFNCGSWANLTYVSLTRNSNSTAIEAKINTLLKDSRMETSDGKLELKLEPLKKVYFDSGNNKFDGSVHGNRQTVLLYLAISILMLLMVMINYINLSTAISGSRIKEFAIQMVNGAKRIQIVKQMMLEAFGVAFISFIVALFIVALLLPQFNSLLNLSISPSMIRSWLYVYYFMGTVVIGLMMGLIPGIFLSKIDAMKALKNESVLKMHGMRRKLLLVLQLIIVAVLLNSTFIIKKQIAYVINKDLGFQYKNVISFELNKTLEDRIELLQTNLLKNPEIENVAFSDGLIGAEFSKHPTGIGDVEKLCNFYTIDPNYLALYKIKIKYGRNFSPDYTTDLTNSCIINEEACSTFGIENPVGKSLKNNKVIIGVVYNFNFTSLHNKIEPLVMTQGNGKVVQIRIAAFNPKETIHFIKNTCKSLAPDFVCNVSFLDQRMKQLYTAEFKLKSSFEVYALITLIVALLGLFGLTLFMIKKKTKEIGIRKLYGARLIDTCKLFTKEQIWIALISNLFAIPITLCVMNHWLANFQFSVHIGFMVFLETFCITIVFTLLAVSFLIVKTHKTNLIETLKHE